VPSTGFFVLDSIDAIALPASRFPSGRRKVLNPMPPRADAVIGEPRRRLARPYGVEFDFLYPSDHVRLSVDHADEVGVEV